MARIPLNYWEKRSTELMKQMEKGTEKTINSLVQAYEQATKDINKEIERIFYNYGEDTGLKKETLLKLLNSKETETHYNNLLKTINKISNKDIRKKMLAKYNAPAYQYRISRYEALQQNIDVELKKLADIEKNVTEIRYTDTLKEGYNKSIYNVQKKLGIGFNFSQIDTKTISLLSNEKWTNNANFSQRIWKNSEKLGNYLKVKLTADTMSGKSIQKISKELSEYMNIGLYNSTRLVRTEVNHFANMSEMLSYQELGIEKYKFIATLDKITCEHCAELDNKVFNVKDAKSGINVPPLHANDRCTTVAVFDEEITEDLKRRAVDEEGNIIHIPQNMSYKDWSMQYAPEYYQKYFINLNLPKTKLVENSVLGKQLGFFNEANILNFIPKNSIIEDIHIIAGNGTKTVFRSANKYANHYGGKAEEWCKKVGKIESDKYIFDVHWVEHQKYGKIDFKLKGKTLK